MSILTCRSFPSPRRIIFSRNPLPLGVEERFSKPHTLAEDTLHLATFSFHTFSHATDLHIFIWAETPEAFTILKVLFFFTEIILRKEELNLLLAWILSLFYFSGNILLLIKNHVTIYFIKQINFLFQLQPSKAQCCFKTDFFFL